MNSSHPDHFYTFGDFYEALDAFDDLQVKLGRLKRKQLLTDQEWKATRQCLSDIRARIERHLAGAA